MPQWDIWWYYVVIGPVFAILGWVLRMQLASQEASKKEIVDIKIRLSVVENDVEGMKDDIKDIKNSQFKIIDMLQELLEKK